MSTGHATAPASSGNIGPGFDCLAIALELRCSVTAEPADGWLIEQDGASRPGGEGELVVRAVRMTVDRPMRLKIENDIPRARGLGSSSAVTTAAAAAAARALRGEPDREMLFDVVTELEGHADNAAAAVYGGLVLADSGGGWTPLELSARWRIVVAIPDYPLPTDQARAVLPQDISLYAAARNLARMGFLMEGLRTGDGALLANAGGDELHELPRQELSPGTGELMTAATGAGAAHAAWSGAGPSALAICSDDAVPDVIEAMEKVLGGRGEVALLEVATDGLV